MQRITNLLKKEAFIAIALVATVNAIGYGIVIPLLYPYSQKFGLTDFQNGLLFAVFSICAFLSAPIIGRLSDKYGRKPLLLISILGTAVSFFLQAEARTAGMLFFARALDGITAGNIPVAMAVISDITEPKDRAKGFGIIGASFGFGFVLGPAISAATSHNSLRTPFIVAGIMTLLASAAVAFLLKETNENKGVVSNKKLFDFKKLGTSLFSKTLGEIFLVTLFYNLAWAALVYGFQPFAVKVVGLDVQQISKLFVMFGVVGLFTQGFFMPKLASSFNKKWLFNISLFIAAAGVALLAISSKTTAFVAVMFIVAVSNSFITPLISTFLSENSSPQEQGTVMGLNSSYSSLGSIFGPIIAGAIATVSIPGTFIFSALLILLCLIVFTSFSKIIRVI